jgi:hypothetical protein
MLSIARTSNGWSSINEKNGLRWDFDCVVIDELSSFKNYQSQRFKWRAEGASVRETLDRMTGTPTSNGPNGSLGGDRHPGRRGAVRPFHKQVPR